MTDQPEIQDEPTLADRLAGLLRHHWERRERHEAARLALLEAVAAMLAAGEITPDAAFRIVGPHDFEPGRDAEDHNTKEPEDGQ